MFKIKTAKTVDQVVAVFTNAIADLQTIADEKRNQVELEEIAILESRSRIAVAKAEAERADAVRKNIEKLANI